MANPQRAFEKWKRNAASNQQAMKDGANDVTESPGVAANRVKDKYIRRVQESFNDGTYEAGNTSYTTDDWKKAYINKGIPNAQTGVANISARSQQNMVAAVNQANAIKAECANMPNNNKAEALQKVSKAMDMWEQFKRNRSR